MYNIEIIICMATPFVYFTVLQAQLHIVLFLLSSQEWIWELRTQHIVQPAASFAIFSV